jgi:hypothetical protein
MNRHTALQATDAQVEGDLERYKECVESRDRRTGAEKRKTVP